MREKIITIILARGGSKGLKKKNIRLINGKTLIAKVIADVKASRIGGNILVSTDNKEIATEAKNNGAEVPFLRPDNLAEDLTTTEESLKHALVTYEEIKKEKYDIGVFVTATDIFRDPYWIYQAVEILKKNPKLESVFVGHNTHKNFWEKDDDGKWVRLKPWMSKYSSRQIKKPIIREDTGLACASRTYLWREGKRIGDNVEIITNDDDFTSIDIHTEEDLKLAEFAMRIRNSK